MKATGIVVEYNPFHNGHRYHVSEAKQSTNADVVIAVMSGNFLQRGEPAFVDKWTRTQMALAGGVDLVFELPYAFATAHAPVFASGAIRLLDAIHCESFCFGSEEGEIEPFENTLDLLHTEHETYEALIQSAVRQGLSYPKALNEAYKQIIRENGESLALADLTKPNNILGFHYIQAAHSLHLDIRPVTIPRIVADFHDDAVKGNSIASATGIRKSFFDSPTIENIESFIPKTTLDQLLGWQTERKHFGSWDHFYPQLRTIILRDGPQRLALIADITEGIENLMVRAAQANDTFEGFMAVVKSKRYTWTRIQRMLTHIFTGFTTEQRQTMETPSYLRLLGMTKAGQQYLNQNKKQLKLPLISKTSAFTDPLLQMDVKASDLYALGISRDAQPPIIGLDYHQTPIIHV